MEDIYALDEVERLLELKSAARRAYLVVPGALAYTNPKLCRHFLERTPPGLDDTDQCRSHELLLAQKQTFHDHRFSFISAVCARCKLHFHIKTDIRHVCPTNEEHRHHMLVQCGFKSTDELRANQEEYDDTIDRTRFICVAADCLFNIEISVVSRRIPAADIERLLDRDRVAQNLATAREQDPDRYAEFNGVFSPGPDGMLRKYLADSLRNTTSPLRINKRNKKFLVCMSDDFDPLLKSLGFYEGVDSESGEPCWFITPPGQQYIDGHITSVQTLPARMEDALLELDILHGELTIPAWDKIVQGFQAKYKHFAVKNSYINSCDPDDLVLLGCLIDYPPACFSWAAILLAQIRPRDRDQFLEAGLRLIQNRSDDASTEIIMFKSQFDEGAGMDATLQEAFAFFDASPEQGLTADWFMAKYYEMAKGDVNNQYLEQRQRYLQAIGSYFGQDMLGEVEPKFSQNFGESGLMTSTPNESGRRMSIGSAARLLKVEPNYTAEIIRGFVDQLIHNENVDRAKVVEAVDVLSELKRQQDMPEEAADLQNIAEFVKMTESVPILAPQPHASPRPAMFVDTPPGLKNIGNTCYLNSLLQYFYNVKVVRDLVLNFDQIKLDLDEETVAQRRTGGNGTSVNLEEAIVARQFVEMLQGLFADLQSTTEIAAQPSQKLANTALSSARDILDQPSQAVPPPLPARPSPAPPVPPKENVETANGTTDAVSVTVESLNEKHETASSRSSQTLVNDGEDAPMSFVQLETPGDDASFISQPHDDIKMHDSVETWTLDDKFAEVSRRLEHSDRSGTSQQDVGEIIGNILEHFMRAIRPDGPMPFKPDLQADKITETFFITIVNYTTKTKKGSPSNDSTPRIEESPLNQEIVPERWITAYPKEVEQASNGTSSMNEAKATRCTLTEALDPFFGYEPIDDGSRARYSSIKSLPFILHICIQRSTPKGKNMNPVIIPEILYLDRYMEAEKDSPVWLARKRAWALKERLKDLDALSTQVTDGPIEMTEAGVPNAQTSGLEFTTPPDSDSPEEDAAITSLFFEDTRVGEKRKSVEPFESSLSKKAFPPQSPVRNQLSDKFGDIDWEISKPLDEMSRAEVIELRKNEEATFDGMQQHKFSIHAVICHRGNTAAGHYWVWIRDFSRNVWYRYNDENVTEDSRGTEAVLNDLNETGDPYYVAYVKDDMKDELVDVPQRYRFATEDLSTGTQEVEMIEGVALDPA
ncbi:cysteine proteinase [Hypomontagnella monticulosa]|nr:cysteine proteinase [Hypomontagnella monticulosa]